MYKVYLEYVNAKNDLFLFKCSDCNENYEREFDENLANRFKVHKDFVTKRLRNLVPYCEKMFIRISTWIVGRDLMKHNCLKKKNFTAT